MMRSPVLNSKGLHPVVFLQDLWDQFFHSARKNTKKGLETCGVLCGTLVKEEYHVTHIIIPVQNGGPDYCYAENKEELFFIQEELGLLTLGFFHTHPTQTGFLSSVDLYTVFAVKRCCQNQLQWCVHPNINSHPTRKGSRENELKTEGSTHAMTRRRRRRMRVAIFTLTPFGLKEISFCPQRRFHSHKQDSALFYVPIYVQEIKAMFPAMT
ncbi:STAM-binding protein-like [Peromyscus maniculatus bairdii]|uniref:STAM-binding protein-like n=1 Tax=Peromyscus maniculatus bairdii TaxID=230844 RepID=UPI003FD55F06